MQDEWIDYINHIVSSTPGLSECIRTNSRVTKVRRTNTEGYAIAFETRTDGRAETNMMKFDRVIVAMGRTQKPTIQNVKGLQNFRGRTMHSKEYRTPAQFRGESVLILGGSISGTECAGDLCETNTSTRNCLTIKQQELRLSCGRCKACDRQLRSSRLLRPIAYLNAVSVARVFFQRR